MIFQASKTICASAHKYPRKRLINRNVPRWPSIFHGTAIRVNKKNNGHSILQSRVIWQSPIGSDSISFGKLAAVWSVAEEAVTSNAAKPLEVHLVIWVLDYKTMLDSRKLLCVVDFFNKAKPNTKWYRNSLSTTPALIRSRLIDNNDGWVCITPTQVVFERCWWRVKQLVNDFAKSSRLNNKWWFWC